MTRTGRRSALPGGKSSWRTTSSRCLPSLAAERGALPHDEVAACTVRKRASSDVADDAVQLHGHDHPRAEHPVDTSGSMPSPISGAPPHDLRIVLASSSPGVPHGGSMPPAGGLTTADVPSKSFHEVTTLNGRSRSTRQRSAQHGPRVGQRFTPALAGRRHSARAARIRNDEDAPQGVRSGRSFR